MVKRLRLRSRIALAIMESLGTFHALSLSNALRYTRPRLQEYGIRRNTPLSKRDWDLALQVVREHNVHRSARTRFYRELEREPNPIDRLSIVLRSLGKN